MTRAAPAGRDLLLAAALAAAPYAAALEGVAGPFAWELNLGPGDGPYVRGFLPKHEVDDKVGTHWSTYDSAVVLPLTVRGGLRTSYRLRRVLPETAEVDVAFDGRPVDRFSCRGGAPVEREAPVSFASDGSRPVELSFRVDSHDRKGLGLRMDRVGFVAGEGARVALSGTARWRAALLAALVFAALRAGGWSPARAALLAAPWAAALAAGLLWDPWRVHRHLTGLPETLALAASTGLVAGRALVRRGRLPAADLPLLALLGLTALLLRGAAVNHPDFYYPDLMTHARLVGVVREAGLGFFAAPALHVGADGAWTKPAYGGSAVLPYAVGFHSLFLLGPRDYDALLTAQKLVGVVTTLVPLLLVWALARRLGVTPLGAVLMLLVPTYTSRLSFALLPALLGHALDVALIFWLAGRLETGFRGARAWAAGAGLVALCQVSYVSSVTNVTLLLGALALLAGLDAPPGERLRRGLSLLGIGAAGSALAVLAYYRGFLGSAGELVPRLLGPASEPSRYPVESFVALTYVRTRDFFGLAYPVLALAGAVALRRIGRARALLGAWLGAYLLLLLLRAKIPDVFRYGHETLFVTPLVCLLAGAALAALWARGRGARLLTGALVLWLAVQGGRAQFRAIADQTANAL